jgi:hypothetical protein
MEITVTCHPWSLKITILGTKRVSRKMGAYHLRLSLREPRSQCKQTSAVCRSLVLLAFWGGLGGRVTHQGGVEKYWQWLQIQTRLP